MLKLEHINFPAKDPSWTEVRAETKLREEMKRRGIGQGSGEYSVVVERGQARVRVRRLPRSI